MSEWPVGLSTGCFYQEPILECLTRIQQKGFNLIEICSAPAHLDYHDNETLKRAAAKIRELHLEPYSFHAPFADHIDITESDDRKRDRALREILTAAEAAAALGVGYFVIHPGPEREGIPESERLERLNRAATVLNEIARHCRELGLGLVLENMLPHLFAGHVRDLLWMLGSLDTTDVGICLDTGHAYLSGDLRTVAQKLSGHLWMVHASDNHGKFDDHIAPGDGAINWDSILRQLRQSGFHGPLILELSGDLPPDRVLDDALRAQQTIRQVSRRLRLFDLAR